MIKKRVSRPRQDKRANEKAAKVHAINDTTVTKPAKNKLLRSHRLKGHLVKSLIKCSKVGFVGKNVIGIENMSELGLKAVKATHKLGNAQSAESKSNPVFVRINEYLAIFLFFIVQYSSDLRPRIFTPNKVNSNVKNNITTPAAAALPIRKYSNAFQ